MVRKNIVLLLIDICMTILLVLMYNVRSINMTFHELGGILLLIIFLIHMIGHHKWIISTFKKLFSPSAPVKDKIEVLLSLLLFLAVILIGVSGILISKVLFRHMGISSFGWKSIHQASAAAFLILIGIHIGLHRQFIFTVFGKCLHLPKKTAAVIGILLTLILFTYGSYSIVSTGYIRMLIPQLSSHSMERGFGNFPQGNDNTNGGPSMRDNGQNAPDRNRDGVNAPGNNNDNSNPPGNNNDNGNPPGNKGDNGNFPNSDDGNSYGQSKLSTQGGSNNPDRNNAPGSFGDFAGGKQPSGDNQSVNILTMLRTIAGYFSILYIIATITALIDFLIMKGKKPIVTPDSPMTGPSIPKITDMQNENIHDQN